MNIYNLRIIRRLIGGKWYKYAATVELPGLYGSWWTKKLHPKHRYHKIVITEIWEFGKQIWKSEVKPLEYIDVLTPLLKEGVIIDNYPLNNLFETLMKISKEQTKSQEYPETSAGEPITLTINKNMIYDDTPSQDKEKTKEALSFNSLIQQPIRIFNPYAGRYTETQPDYKELLSEFVTRSGYVYNGIQYHLNSTNKIYDSDILERIAKALNP